MTLFLDLVCTELEYARQKHPHPIASTDEAARIIREEFEEFVTAARRPDGNTLAVLAELASMAAMCARAAEDLGIVQDYEPPFTSK